MKKALLILLIMIFTLSGCAKKTPVTGNVISITPSEIVSNFDNKEDFFLVVSLTTCPICAEYKLGLAELVKNYQVDVYVIEIDLYEEDFDLLSENYLDILTDAPDSFLIKEGNIVFEKTGFIQYRNLVNILKEHDFVK